MPKPLPLNEGHLLSAPWVSIIQSRLLLCFVIGAYTFLDPNLKSQGTLKAYIASYFIFIILFAFLKPETLALKRVRIIPAIADVFFITLLVLNSVGPDNSWFLFYIFPILSASRYLGYWGALSIATFSIIMYLASYVASASGNGDVNPYTFTLRCLVLIGVAAVAGNLARAKRKEQDKLIQVLEEIDHEILGDARIEQVLNLMLRKCLEFTNSEMGHIRLIDKETQEYRIAAVIGHPEGYEWGTLPFDETYSRVAVQTRKPLLVPQISKRHLTRYLGTYFRLRRPRPKSALFAPLLLKGSVIGVIAVYSRRRLHYTNIDASKLMAFTTLIELAIRTDAAKERHLRLQLLNEIGERLKSGLNLPDLFKLVVELTICHLDSEESALFVRNDKDESRIDKVEVCGPDREVTKKLREVETSYSSGDSFTGRVFKDNSPYLENDVDPAEQHAQEYAEVLPSQAVRHYLGVPLVVDDEVLGVIRVLNKKSSVYSSANAFALSDKGFKNEDVELMNTIASLVAPELRSAGRRKKLVEAQRYLKNLLLESPDPIISLDKHGRIVIFNKACQTLWGVSYEEAKGKSVEDYYESAEHARAIGKMLGESAGHRLENVEARIKSKQGEIIPISLSAALLFDEDGKKDGSLGVFRDLREYKRMEAELVEAARLSTVAILARTAGHDIKHNIATALAYVDGLMAKYEKDKDRRLFDIYTNIKDALQESLDELQDLLMADKSKPRHKTKWAVEHIFQRIEQQLRRKAAESNIRLSVNYPEEGWAVSADIDQIARVFSNLFTNSRDAIKERRGADEGFDEGQIEVSGHIDGSDVNLIWEDNGCGISEEHRHRIFDAFFTKKQGDIGSGLGLYIVKTIIESHGGRVAADPKHGKGARFRVTLPVSDAARDGDGSHSKR